MTDPITPEQMREALDRALAEYIIDIDRAVHFVSIEQVDMLAEFYLHNRAIVAGQQKPHTYVGGEASVAVCPICDIAGCYHIRAAALDVSETPESERQTDLLSESERQAIRDKALEDAAQCCEAEADKCDDAVKWGGATKYIANCKAAAYAMRDRAYTIRLMKGKPE